MSLEPAFYNRQSLARGLARQTLSQAATTSADTGALITTLHDVAPNLQSRRRFGKRLTRQTGVIRCALTDSGLSAVFRSTFDVTLRKDREEVWREPRIAWTRVVVLPSSRIVSFYTAEIHLTLHAIQRHIERSDAPMKGLLSHLDDEMVGLLCRLRSDDPLHENGDDFFAASSGLWAGGFEARQSDGTWGAAFDRPHLQHPVFSIRTFLGEDQMRPTLWLAWSRALAKNGTRVPMRDLMSGTCAA